jgi:hypothetical protein
METVMIMMRKLDNGEVHKLYSPLNINRARKLLRKNDGKILSSIYLKINFG